MQYIKIMSEIQSINNNDEAPDLPEQYIIYDELRDTFDPKMQFIDLYHNSSISEFKLVN